jgi:hypothetical protein
MDAIFVTVDSGQAFIEQIERRGAVSADRIGSGMNGQRDHSLLFSEIGSQAHAINVQLVMVIGAEFLTPDPWPQI